MKEYFYINNYPINSGSHCFITMDSSYNSDWNDFVKIECEKLRKKGHVFDAEGTHMKLLGEKYQKKLAREKKKNQTNSKPSNMHQNNEDVASCINTMNIASNCCTLSGYVNEVSRCEGIYQEWLVTNPSKAKLLHDELIRHQRQVSIKKAKCKYDDKRKAQKREEREAAKAMQQEAEAKAKQQQEEIARVQKEAEAKAKQQLEYEANRRDEMLRIRAKQQEEIARVQKEAEAKRIQDIAAAKALQDLLEVREREAKTKEEERIRAVIEAKKHREELEKAKARAIEAEELVKAMEREQFAKSKARAKQLEEIVKANARAKELEEIVKANQEEEFQKIKAQLEKERKEFENFKALTIEREKLAVVANAVSKFALVLQGEIERRKHDKNPVKFRLMRKSNTESKLAIALKEVINRRRKIKLGLL